MLGLYQMCMFRKHVFFCFVFVFGGGGVCKIRMPRKPIYFWMFGFTQNMHVYNTVVFLNCWFYTKFACPENQLVFGLLVLYQICMPRKHLFWECWGYSKFACPGNFFLILVLYKICMSRKPIYFWNVGFIPNLHVQTTHVFFFRSLVLY